MMQVKLNYLYFPREEGKPERAKGENSVSLLELKIIINGNILIVSREMDPVIYGHSCLRENANRLTL